MYPMLLAGAYALIGDILATFVAATIAVLTRRQAGKTPVGIALGFSAGFIVAAAFLYLVGEAQDRSHNTVVIAAGIALGLLVMIGLQVALGAFGLGEEEEGEEDEDSKDKPGEEEGTRRASIISIGMAIHNVPEAFPIGAALVISPALSLLVAVVMMAETFAESGAIAGELVDKNASAARIYGLTMWPSIFSLFGGILGVVLAGISPIILALTLALAAGIMLFITGEIWGDSRRKAGSKWSSVGLAVGVVLALLSSTVARG